MAEYLESPADRVQGDDWLPLEWQFTRLGTPYKWVSVGGASATIKIVDDDGNVVLDDADTQGTGATCSVADDGRVSCDVTDDLAALLTGTDAGTVYWYRFEITLADGSVYRSPRIKLTVYADL